MYNSKKALELAIFEYEKDLEYEETNQWVENVLKGLKEVKQDLEKLEKVIKILEDNLQLVLKKDIDPLLNRKVYAVGISKNYKIYSGFEITQEQYELLKEVLSNER